LQSSHGLWHCEFLINYFNLFSEKIYFRWYKVYYQRKSCNFEKWNSKTNCLDDFVFITF